MHSARETLKLEQLDAIRAGEHTFALTPDIRAVAFRDLFRQIEPLDGSDYASTQNPEEIDHG